MAGKFDPLPEGDLRAFGEDFVLGLGETFAFGFGETFRPDPDAGANCSNTPGVANGSVARFSGAVGLAIKSTAPVLLGLRRLG